MSYSSTNTRQYEHVIPRTMGRGEMSLYYQRFKTEEQRFLEKVNKTDTCWLWIGATQKEHGYALFRFQSVDGSNGYLAHRFSYEMYVGNIPEGLQIDHTCEVKNCVNPNHLEPVTCLVNVNRASAHYATRTHCSHGHEFTEENTQWRADGGRRCLECQRLRSIRRREAGEWRKKVG